MVASVLRQWLWCISLLAVVLIAGCASTPTAQCHSTTQQQVSDVQRQAEAGDAEAQRQLARWYGIGYCLPKDNPKAAEWYQRAAESFKRAAQQGDSDAQFRLGQMLFNGTGVEEDESEAVVWFRKAAEQGHANAQVNLGNLYYEGTGVQKDLDQAEYWYRKAAEQGNWSAKQKLSKVIKEQDPEAWEREQARLAEAEAEKKQRAEEEAGKRQREQARTQALVAQNRFGRIGLSVGEIDVSEEVRTGPNGTAKTRSAGGGYFKHLEQSGEGIGYLVGFGSWLGPVGAAAGLVVGLTAVGQQASGRTYKPKPLSKEEKAAIKEALRTLTTVLETLPIERDFQAQIMASAQTQQAHGLVVALPTEQDINTRLAVEVTVVGLMRTPANPRTGQLWMVARAALVDPTDQQILEEKEYCYASSARSALVAWMKDNGQALRQGIAEANHHLANRILTDMVGLAPDPQAPASWSATPEKCVFKRAKEVKCPFNDPGCY